MKVIQGTSRDQLELSILESLFTTYSPLRVMDMFVEKVDNQKLGFKEKASKSEGLAGYESQAFLKLYLYGYFYGIRSSRKLEREAARNIQLPWLLCKLVPNYHSIADFRKVIPQAL